MIQVNKKHSVQYKNGYFILKWHSKNERGEQTTVKTQTYPDIGSMVLQCGFTMDYEYTDAAMQSKRNYERKVSSSYLKAKETLDATK